MPMPAWLLLALLAADGEPASEALLRQLVARTATAQVESPSTDWQMQQRDCAGLIRYAYATAFRTLGSERPARGMWRNSRGRATGFADAETLVTHNFVLLGRDPLTQEGLRSGDLLAFRRVLSDGGEPVYHLMLVVRPDDPAHGEPYVIYHPGGAPEDPVRIGSLRSLADDAPVEWQPLPHNNSFLGYFRFKEWSS